MLRDIIDVQAVGEYRLHLRFEDGVEGEVDLTKLIEFRGVFAPLREIAEVQKVMINRDLGTVCWPNGADLDPDVLYSAVTGEPIDLEEAAIAS